MIGREADLLHVDATGEDVGRDEDARGADAEVLEDSLALGLLEVGMQCGAGEVARVHLLGEPLDLAARRHEDDGLRDRERAVELAQRLQLVPGGGGAEETMGEKEAAVAVAAAVAAAVAEQGREASHCSCCTSTKNCLMPSSVCSSRLTSTRTASADRNLAVSSSTCQAAEQQVREEEARLRLCATAEEQWRRRR